MSYMICAVVALIFVIRLAFLKISIQNEKAILANGGKEYGAANSKRITILHILFYAAAPVEAVARNAQLDAFSWAGLVLMAFSMIMLYVVVNLLSGIWTVKLMLVKNHKFNNHWLFRVVKHPNYFLNIVAELTGLVLLCHAWYAGSVLAPLYAVVLFLRIKEENALLRDVIIPNGISN